MKRTYFGNAGHLIVGNWCRFHITTRIGDVLVSTVGEYYPRPDDAKPTTIGVNRLYETMVFRVADGSECQCGCGLPFHDGSEIDFAAYNDPKDANAGHERMCAKYEQAVQS